MKKILLVIFSLSLLLACGAAAYGKVIENFNNDASLSDQADTPDGKWEASFALPSDAVFKVDSAITIDGTSNLVFSVNKTAGMEWVYLFCTDLLKSGNVHNFTNYTTLSADVYGNVKLLAKLVDFRTNDNNVTDHETKDIGTVSAANTAGWTRVTWDLSTLDWQSCDRTVVNKLYLFFQPGEQGQVSFRIDNIKLEPDPAQFTIKNLLIDNYNGGSELNRVGGAGFYWPDKSKDKFLKLNMFDANPSQVHGRTGKSLQFWYGDAAGGMELSPAEFGYSQSLMQRNYSNYGAVSFWVNGPAGGETFQLGFKDINGLEKKMSINNYIQYLSGDAKNGIVKDQWRKVLIPLSVFPNVDFTNMDAYTVTFPGNSKGMVFFDDLLFHTFAWMNLQDFEGGNIWTDNGLGAGTLGKGNFSIETVNVSSGTYAGRINSGVDSLVDNFDDGADPNFWGGTNAASAWWTVGMNSVASSYDAVVKYGTGAASLNLSFDNTTSPTDTCGLIINLGTPNHNCDGYDYIYFMARSTNTGLNFKIGLEDGSGHAPRVEVKSYVSGGLNATWQQVAIRIADFKAVDGGLNTADLQKLVFEFSRSADPVNTAATFNIDDLEFGRNGAWMSMSNADLSKYDSLVFNMKGFAGAEKVNVRLQDTLSGGHNSNEVTLTATTGWVRQKIGFSQFTGVDISAVSAIHFGILTRDATVYIDDIQLGDGSNSTLPVSPTAIMLNGETAAGGMVLMPRNLLSAHAPNYALDNSMEGVRFEYSSDGVNWNSMGVDYDVDNTEYALGWNATSLIGQGSFKIHAVSQNIMGNDSLSSLEVANLTVQSQDVFVYPNPYYPNKGSKKVHFVNVVTGGVLKIYTISGELVITLKDDGYVDDEYENDGMVTWDGRNSDGSLLASGIYLFMLTKDKGKVSSGKFVVIK